LHDILLFDTVLEGDKRYSAREGKPVGSLAQSLKDSVPMARYGTPENVSGLVSYISSDEADYMTGQSLSLNGGLFND